MNYIDTLKVSHPNFAYCSKGSATNNNHILFIFTRPLYNEPTAEQRSDYERRACIVEANGGHMNKSLHEEAGEFPRFNKKDVADIKRLVARTHKDMRVVSHWNGEGCTSLTVACLSRSKAKRRTSDRTEKR